MLQYRLDDVGVVVDAELVGDGQQDRVGFLDAFVAAQLFDEIFGRVGIGAAEGGALGGLDVAEMILAGAAAEIGAGRGR